ncbi:MAG: hydantoinase/oxoprolinase family protein [Candidatus Latescibacteria bacterium]|nr:hydantoinase/oxoprolinase family protein [Candidatus Latescibacterota bacterium]
MAYRLGVDIGGTFTDATLVDEASGAVATAKVPSTPAAPAVGFMAAVERILAANQVGPDQVSYIVHGTTVATNAIIEGKVARTAFLTTAGFRDMLEIARQIRPALYDLHFEKTPPLVPRQLCFGVPERLAADGQVLLPLDDKAVRQIAAQLQQAQVEAVAVCLLHAYARADHEERVGAILEELLPGVAVSLSSAVAPEFREYLRASTTVINACIRPVVERYLAEIGAGLRGAGLTAELLVMQSSGGVFSAQAAAQRPVYMVESGPAAGVIGAAHLGRTCGYGDIISFDMGGTTAKAGLVQDGQPRVTKDYEVGSRAQASGAGRGQGYPIRTPVIDLVEIGAGGGSIAWVDSGGGLRVGPHSAGASPGPVCYGQGGQRPTITDANAVLGRLNPEYFLGGEIGLDVAAAGRAIEEYCARPLGMDTVAAAYGIVEIANAAMVNALRLVSVQRGYDPRQFALVAFGGGGPVHANRLAAMAQIPTTVIPASPGTASALGLLTTDLEHEYSATVLQRLEGLDAAAVERLCGQLAQEGRQALDREGVEEGQRRLARLAELRYVGQSFELTVDLPEKTLDQGAIGELLAQFHQAHERAYGFSAPGEPVELVNVRLRASGRIARPASQPLAVGSGVVAAQRSVRPVYFAECEGFVECPIYDRYKLEGEAVVEGPAVIEEIDSTTVLHPGYVARVDPLGPLILRPA